MMTGKDQVCKLLAELLLGFCNRSSLPLGNDLQPGWMVRQVVQPASAPLTLHVLNTRITHSLYSSVHSNFKASLAQRSPASSVLAREGAGCVLFLHGLESNPESSLHLHRRLYSE